MNPLDETGLEEIFEGETSGELVPIEITLTGEARLPSYATPGSVGMDLRTPTSFRLEPGERRLIPTGLRVAIPDGYEGQIRARSGLAAKHGVGLVNSPGTIDSDFRGEIAVLLINWGESVVEISAGERIAQFVVCPVARAEWIVVDELTSTERGEGGFGSTGRA